MPLRASMNRIVLCLLLATPQLFMPRRAAAWIFPEHTELTRLGFERNLPEAAREELSAAMAAAREAGLRICEAIDPLDRVPEAGRTCVPYSALPALAGDHANTSAELRTLIESGTAQKIVEAIAKPWREYLDYDALPETARLYRSRAWLWYKWLPSSIDGTLDGATQRRFTRKLDLVLNAADIDYTDRSQGSRAHFQDSLTPISDLLHQLTSRGNVDNALGQVLAHHLRSLQLAAAAAKAEGPQAAQDLANALLEHAMALHFVQDAFAAGHMGTEARLAIDEEKLRRHDFLNRAGLSVQRTTLSSRCDIVSSAGGEVPSGPSASPCWVAYGDAYLDEFNARIVADATARIQMQFALAVGLRDHASLFSRLLSDAAPSEVESKFYSSPPAYAIAGDLVEGKAYEPTYVSSLEQSQSCTVGIDRSTNRFVCEQQANPTSFVPLAQKAQVQVYVMSDDFDPYLVIRKGDEKVTANQNASRLDTFASATFEVDPKQVYEVVVGVNDVQSLPQHDAKAPREGHYVWWIEAAPATESVPKRTPVGCRQLREVAGLLDPAPDWALSETARRERADWTEEDWCRRSRYVLSSVQAALLEVSKQNVPMVSAGGTSGAEPGAVPESILSHALHPCRPVNSWRLRNHPMCSSPGTEFQFGEPGPSLFHPILAAWPVPMGDVLTLEGKDAFRRGFAVQMVFGAGSTLGLQSKVPLSFEAFFGTGLSYRATNLFPERENRELIELNVAFRPTVLVHSDTRLLVDGFLEARIPIIPLLLAGIWGATTATEYGPLGYRLYFVWFNQLPGGGGAFPIGHDLEVANFVLGSGTEARNKPAGHILDKEIRLRIGIFRERWLLGTRRETWVPTISAEFAWGHATFLGEALGSQD
jgi:hypothetical protein